MGTAVVFGQQPSGLMCASRGASKHLPTRTLGSLDMDAARISLAFAPASALLALFGHPGVGLLDVQGVDPILGGFVVFTSGTITLMISIWPPTLVRTFSAT